MVLHTDKYETQPLMDVIRRQVVDVLSFTLQELAAKNYYNTKISVT